MAKYTATNFFYYTLNICIVDNLRKAKFKRKLTAFSVTRSVPPLHCLFLWHHTQISASSGYKCKSTFASYCVFSSCFPFDAALQHEKVSVFHIWLLLATPSCLTHAFDSASICWLHKEWMARPIDSAENSDWEPVVINHWPLLSSMLLLFLCLRALG